MERIEDLKNWTVVEDGWQEHFRYVIGAKVAYEIFVNFHFTDTPIETAKADLCLTGLWCKKGLNGSIFEREWLGRDLPVQELLKIAAKDLKRMQ